MPPCSPCSGLFSQCWQCRQGVSLTGSRPPPCRSRCSELAGGLKMTHSLSRHFGYSTFLMTSLGGEERYNERREVSQKYWQKYRNRRDKKVMTWILVRKSQWTNLNFLLAWFFSLSSVYAGASFFHHWMKPCVGKICMDHCRPFCITSNVNTLRDYDIMVWWRSHPDGDIKQRCFILSQ